MTSEFIGKYSSAGVRALARKAAIGVILGLAGMTVHAAVADPVAKTSYGSVRGVNRGGVDLFLGVPYAAPPVGKLRWMPPVEHASWKGTREATSFAPSCAQITELGAFAGPANENEDCLYLNVIRPAGGDASSRKFPVLFWIHGGGFVDGSSSDYDASKLAARGRVVVVSINYRLNLLGFLAHPALDKEGHLFANYGLLDQQQALRWVKKNAAAFGGDPDNITVGGQSAGGGSSGYHVISPLAKGLFQKAIIESSASYLTAIPLDVAEERAKAFSVAAGCGAGNDKNTAACLRNLSVATILKFAGTPSAWSAYTVTPVIDGQILQSGAAAAFASGKFQHMPIMNGSTRDEGNFFVAAQEYFSGDPRHAISREDVQTYVKNVFSGNAGAGGTQPAYPAGTVEGVLKQYPSDAYPSEQLRLNAIETDVMVCRIQHGSRLLAGQVPVYAYEFRDRTAPFYFPEMPDFLPLAYHTADLLYLFPGFHGGDQGIKHELNAPQRKLSDYLVDAWANFAWTGNPNRKGDVPWPLYRRDPAVKSILAQDIFELSVMSDGDFSQEHKCDFWDDKLVYN